MAPRPNLARQLALIEGLPIAVETARSTDTSALCADSPLDSSVASGFPEVLDRNLEANISRRIDFQHAHIPSNVTLSPRPVPELRSVPSPSERLTISPFTSRQAAPLGEPRAEFNRDNRQRKENIAKIRFHSVIVNCRLEFGI